MPVVSIVTLDMVLAYLEGGRRRLSASRQAIRDYRALRWRQPDERSSCSMSFSIGPRFRPTPVT
ncbi:hypothetical protein DSL92_07985 [Billgrantia gudaonensis]|uniref:Uncharacterized protein n=1 Tax=Billgrantia gudaonensis TaxID=376427 RepID=A0A3S0Q0V2_9GAMM|nr:hypothetical protein DSL92_07985 [Halomonas gudaonensis]